MTMVGSCCETRRFRERLGASEAEATGSSMSDAELDRLLEETTRQRIGPLWLAEIREACSGVSRHFDPAVYGVAEGSWTAGEIDDLVQDVTTEQLLKQAQLDYIIDVASSIEDVGARWSTSCSTA